jgi:hypothetical protein
VALLPVQEKHACEKQIFCVLISHMGFRECSPVVLLAQNKACGQQEFWDLIPYKGLRELSSVAVLWGEGS